MRLDHRLQRGFQADGVRSKHLRSHAQGVRAVASETGPQVREAILRGDPSAGRQRQDQTYGRHQVRPRGHDGGDRGRAEGNEQREECRGGGKGVK